MFKPFRVFSIGMSLTEQSRAVAIKQANESICCCSQALSADLNVTVVLTFELYNGASELALNTNFQGHNNYFGFKTIPKDK